MDHKLILKTARENYRRSADYGRGLPDFGNRWGTFKQEMSSRITGFASAAEAIAFGQLRCNFDHRGPVTENDIPEIQVARRLLAYEYPRYAYLIDSFTDTDVSTTGTYLPLPVAGGTVNASKILYFHATYLLTVLSQVGSVRSICEIGGGYGNPALLWMNCPVGPVETYCIIDLPESLFFADVFLRAALPSVDVVYVHDDTVIAPKASRTIYLVPIQHHAKTGSLDIDVVVNTGSLAEMPESWVTFWSNWLDGQTATHFFSHNMFGNPVDSLFEGRATFAPRVSDAWEVKYVRAMHPLVLLQSDRRRFAEIIFERSRAPAHTDDLGLALRALATPNLSLENYVLLAYRAHSKARRTLPDVIGFIKKALSDFGYAPVELLALLASIRGDEAFDRLDEGQRKFVTDLQAELRTKFESAYPKGTHSE